MSEPITGGSTVPDDDIEAPHYASSVSITKTSTCSGVKIGARRYLTAGHCVAGPGSATIGDGSHLIPATPVTITAVYHHPSYDPALALPTSCGQGSEVCTTAYDVAVVDIAQNISAIPSVPLRAGLVAGGTNGFALGFGCDNNRPGRTGVKQQATFTALAPSSGEDRDIHYIRDTGDPSGCAGDSGGPFFVVLAGVGQQVAGVFSGAGGGGVQGTTLFTRLGNVREWILQPENAVNNFGPDQSGSFMNNQRGFCLATIGKADGAPESGRDVKLHLCDGPFGDITRNPVGWRIVKDGSVGGANFFTIRSRQSGKCLDVVGQSTSDNADVRQFDCVAGRASQSWRFVKEFSDSVRGQLINNNSGKCLGAATGGIVNVDVRQFNCSSAARLHWTFVR